MKLKALALAAMLVLVGCNDSEPITSHQGSVLSSSCDGPNCYLIISGRDSRTLHRAVQEFPMCEDYSRLVGEQAWIFQRVKDARTCWVAYINQAK